MEVAHPDADGQGGDAALKEHIGVGAAAGGHHCGREAGGCHRAGDVPQRRVVVRHPVGAILAANVQVNLRFGVQRRRLVKGAPELGGVVVQAGLTKRAQFAVQVRRFGDDVPLQAAMQGANVGGGFPVNSAQGQAAQDVGGHQQGGDAVFRFQPGVGRYAGDVALHHILRRGAHADAAHRPFAVKDDAGAGLHQRKIQVARSVQAAFLGAGEYHLHRTAGNAVLKGRFQPLQHDGQPGLAVAAEDGAAVRPQDIAVGVQRGVDAAPRLHGVHMSGQQHGRIVVRRVDAGAAVAGAAGQGGHQVAVGVVAHGGAQSGEAGGKVGVDGVLLSGGAVDANQVNQGPGKAGAVGHRGISGQRALGMGFRLFWNARG